MSLRPSAKSLLFPAAAAAACALTTGCANMSTTAPSFSTAGAATMVGSIHGGNQPIGNATVKLYAAGTTGYGSASTLYATTTSAPGTGGFTFNKAATNVGNTAPTTNSYGCPATGDPEMYLIAKGGVTQGAGSANNAEAAFIVALGHCSTVSASTFVTMNEVTSVATLAALQQYFNPNTESLGYPGTAQALVGFQNGVSTLSSLASPFSGVAVASSTPTSAVAGVTITATPENSKLNLIANILAACVNSSDTTSGNTVTPSSACTTLFGNAVAPALASTTSQPTLTFATATDTLMAGYYMMVNPTASQDPTGKMANLFNLSAAAGAPFQPSLATQPLDWTLGITYTAAGTCTNSNAATFFSSMESLAVDAAGNIWFNNGQAAAGALGELSPTGAPTVCAFGTIPAGRGLTIDTAGNVWTTGANTTASVYEYLSNGSTLNWPTNATSPATGSANGIASDGSGNIFYIPNGSASPLQEYVAASTATATAPSVSVGGNITSSTGLLYLQADNTGRLWAAGANLAVLYDLYKDTSSAGTNGYSILDAGTASLTTTNLYSGYGNAVDANNNVFTSSTCCAQTVSNTMTRATPNSTTTLTGTTSAKYLGGLVAARSTAVDGAGNVWAGMGYPVVTAALNTAGGVAIYGLAEMSNDLSTGLSPNGSTPATCSSTGSNCATQGGFQKASLGTVRSLAIDPTGNVWAASNGTTQSIVEIVGAGVPVVTPLSVGAKNSTLGTKP